MGATMSELKMVLRPSGALPEATWDEPRFQRWVVASARMNGWRVRVLDVRTGKIRRAQVHEKGWPDLVMAHPEKGVIWAELKAVGGAPRPDQQEMLQTLMLAGAEVHLWFPTDWEAIMVRL